MIKAENANAFKTHFKESIKSLANFHWSPDDNYLAASINNQLHVFNAQTRQWRFLLIENHNLHFVYFANFPRTSWKKWQLRADTVYYLNEQDIVALNTRKNFTQTVMSYDERAPILFSVSYDEKYLQHEVIEQSNSNIWSLQVE